MERMLVAIFDDESKAHKASNDLRRMGDQGVIAVHTVEMFTRGDDGAIAAKNIYDALPEGTMGGAAVGSLLGMLGGPVGLAVGVAGGMLIGATADYARARVIADFAQHVANELKPGRTAIVAEVYEESTDAVDGRLQRLGATILRRDLSDVADTEYEHEIAAIRTDLAEVKAERAAKRADRKAHLRAKSTPLIKKLEEKLARD
jgi:uncharacterized membrane protein